jgi:hypothetical protein
MMNIGWQARNADFQRDEPVAHLFIVGEGRDSRRGDNAQKRLANNDKEGLPALLNR